ncbi:ABC transporter substrate-binding protein [Oryzihumus sp.]|jgi:peptide/nickel transport system substrate-binding protein|uniref:ABC transporter substrate-binding protein n=1 Tax=Oryzihumus sp. TaxID=1968903 RepID=UPI002ED92C53
MMRTKKGALGVALGVAVALAASACGGGSGSTGSSGSTSATKGGTLYMLNLGPVDHWDPQRIYVGADIQFASRVFSRTLTTFPPGKTIEDQSKLIPDLATNTGDVSDGGKTWKFTLKGDAKWQDGKPVTCEDLKYGISRTFAADQITGGPNYAIAYFDIPKNADGSSKYAGPYKKTGQELYDKAVSCSGQTITFHLSQPVNDFNQTVTFPAFGAFRQDKDQGAKSDYQIFSDGPYMLQGSWETNKGGTFVRNPNWSASSDPFRKAYPDSIVYQEGIESETIVQRIMADSGNDKFAVTQATAPPALQAQIVSNPQVKDRSTNPPAPYVDYLLPNFKSKVMSNAKARQAFAMSTNRDAYVTAYGGSTAATPTYAMINKALKGYKDFNPFGVPTAGDPAKAKQVLQSSGLTLPVPITVTYRKRPTSDKALAALQSGWEQAGFKVTLDGISDKYYSTIQNPAYASKADVFWAGWGADWPSGSTVIPPLFDSRPNISAGGSGQDYGYFQNADINKKIDQTFLISDTAAREKAWGDLDEEIAKMGGHVALDNQKFMFVHGSGVKNYNDNGVFGGYVELADIAVK